MKHRHRAFSVILSLIFVLTLASAAWSGALEEITQRGELRVAVQTQGPPFSFIDKNGMRTGSSVEFCRLMAEEMGVKIKFLDFDWDGLIPALMSGKADVLAADMTANLKRALKVSFTDPFYESGSTIFTKKDAPYNSIEDCNKEDVTVALLLGSTGVADANRYLPKAKQKTYKGGGPLLINAVLQGHADVGLNDKSAVRGQLASFPPDTIKILDVEMSAQPLAFAVRPEDQHLKEWINLFFKWIKADGRYDENINYWVESMAWKEDH